VQKLSLTDTTNPTDIFLGALSVGFIYPLGIYFEDAQTFSNG
jgi:hypothetical protein